MFRVVPCTRRLRPKAGPARVRPSAPAAPAFRKSERLSVRSKMVTSSCLLIVGWGFRKQNCVLLRPPERELPVRREVAGGRPLTTELRRGHRHLDRVALDRDPRLAAE